MRRSSKENPYLILTTILLMVVMPALFSCGKTDADDAQLVMLDSLTEKNPDSALTVMSGINASSMRKSKRMYLELLRAKAMNKADSLFTTDSVLLQVADYYDSHGTPNQQMLAHYLLGRAYSDMGSAPRAIEAFHDAEDRADTTSTDCDYGILMRIHSQLAVVYSRLLLFSYEVEECHKAKYYAKKCGDYGAVCVFEKAALTSLYSNGRLEECIAQVRRFINDNKLDENASELSYVSIYAVKSYIELERYDSVSYFLNLYRDFRESYSNITTDGGDFVIPYYEGLTYLGLHKPDSALRLFSGLNTSTLGIEEKGLLYSKLANVYQEMHMTDSALKYSLLCSQINDSCYDMSVTTNCVNAKEIYDYGIERSKTEALAVKAMRLRIFLLCCAFAIAMLAVAVFYFMYKNMRARKEVAEQHLIHKAATESLRQAKAEIDSLSSQKQELEAMLSVAEDKSGSLQAQIAVINDELEQKSSYADELTRRIRALENMMRPEDNVDKDTLLCNSEIVKRFRRSLTSHGGVIEADDWARLRTTVESVFPNFKARVDMDNRLSEADYRVCLLVKAKFTPSDIDSIMQMKHSFASITRKRLHEKVFGVAGSASQFDIKIYSIR